MKMKTTGSHFFSGFGLTTFLILYLFILFNANGAVEVCTDCVFVQVLFRHGDRSPVHLNPTGNYTWPIGLGQLTDLGKLQEYHLGQFLRQRYNHLLGKTYNKSKIHVRSSDFDRTLMSAYCVLASLYPPLNTSENWNPNINWQPIPVHTVPQNEDHLLHTDSDCPRANELSKKLFESDQVQNIGIKYKETINRFANFSGQDPTIEGLFLSLDPAFCDYSHRNDKNHYVPPWIITNIKNISFFMNLESQLKFNTTELQILRGGPLLGGMIMNMNHWINNQTQNEDNEMPNVMLYSAHDTTVNALLKVMGVFDGIHPPYSSCVMVELRRTKKNLYTVRLVYKYITDKNDTKVLNLTKCPGDCSFTAFSTLLKDMVPLNIKQNCSVPSPGSSGISKGTITSIVLGSVAGLLAIVLIVVFVLYMKQRSTDTYRLIPAYDSQI